MKKSVIFLGDVAFNGILSSDNKNNVSRYKSLKKYLTSNDLIFANFEAPVISDIKDLNPDKKLHHYTDSETAKQLLGLLNINCVSLANNHIADCGISGIKTTINLLEKEGIYYTGAGYKESHIKPVIIEHNGLKIAFIAYVHKSTNPKAERYNNLYINYYNINDIINDIESVKKGVDKVIVSIHWGKDYSFYPSDSQINDYKLFIDRGADIIMGHHSHTIQPFEHYNNSTIFYSLGGLTFGDYYLPNGNLHALYKKTKKGVITSLDLDSYKFDFVGTIEKQYNNIHIRRNWNYLKWNSNKWKSFRLMKKNSSYKSFINFKETVLDRITEYFFGYYQNPVKRLFQIKNFKKLISLITNTIKK